MAKSVKDQIKDKEKKIRQLEQEIKTYQGQISIALSQANSNPARRKAANHVVNKARTQIDGRQRRILRLQTEINSMR